MPIQGEWNNLAHISGPIGIKAAAVEFGIGEAFREVLNQRLLERGVPEIAKTQRSKQPDFVPLRILPQQCSLGLAPPRPLTGLPTTQREETTGRRSEEKKGCQYCANLSIASEKRPRVITIECSLWEDSCAIAPRW